MTGIAYAPPQAAASQGHLLDLYVPTRAERPLPVVIWSGARDGVPRTAAGAQTWSRRT